MNSIRWLLKYSLFPCPFFNRTLSHASANATSSSVCRRRRSGTRSLCPRPPPPPFFWPVSCEKQFSTNYCHNMNKFKTENISTEYFQQIYPKLH